MSKKGLKRANGIAIGIEALVDTDRILPKAEGGTYDLENVRILDPVEHLAR